ncbi:hypothetical protein ArsFIN_56230 (plasmid) [Arsenophonus nasoniae]|uniref:Phage transcriptional regulator n=1 Tax=Arsenophonus nasoniae TaxID=638 RepID=A0A4P7LD09_9GAMM|nr:hypothetical protein ArsFIN_56230 [Arsenophonus nasoniae]
MRNYTELSSRHNPKSKMVDIYWIVPLYSTTPCYKVSFTKQDYRTFNAMFKDSRLIWAGRIPEIFRSFH